MGVDGVAADILRIAELQEAWLRVQANVHRVHVGLALVIDFAHTPKLIVESHVWFDDLLGLFLIDREVLVLDHDEGPVGFVVVHQVYARHIFQVVVVGVVDHELLRSLPVGPDLNDRRLVHQNIRKVDARIVGGPVFEVQPVVRDDAALARKPG